MKQLSKKTGLVLVALLTLASLSVYAGDKAKGKPLKVFVLAGQSNMEGKAEIYTIDRLSKSPESLSMFKEMTGGEGKYKVKDDVYIEGDKSKANKKMVRYKGKKYTVVPDTNISFIGAGRSSSPPRSGLLTDGFGDHPRHIGLEFTSASTCKSM